MGESFCEVVHRSVKRDDDDHHHHHHHRHVVINAHDCPEIYARFAFRPLALLEDSPTPAQCPLISRLEPLLPPRPGGFIFPASPWQLGGKGRMISIISPWVQG